MNAQCLEEFKEGSKGLALGLGGPNEQLEGRKTVQRLKK